MLEAVLMSLLVPVVPHHLLVNYINVCSVILAVSQVPGYLSVNHPNILITNMSNILTATNKNDMWGDGSPNLNMDLGNIW